MIHIDEQSTIAQLQELLSAKEWIGTKEQVKQIEKAGDGNMNVVLRIKTTVRSLILKQSRPFVQKYPSLAAPLERIEVEQYFYDIVYKNNTTSHFPKILGFDKENFLMLQEDLGDCRDMIYLYKGEMPSLKQVKTLAQIAHKIHSCPVPGNYPKNHILRQLNHQHIFVLPYAKDNGFSLDTIQMGLQEIANPYIEDTALKVRIKDLGERYLSQGNTLIHGDYYPGSWMSKGEELYVIDPEFSFLGFQEFDLGVMVGHLIMATLDSSHLDLVLSLYPGKIDHTLTAQVAGSEIIRRLIGLAQLPLTHKLEAKKKLLETAHQMLLS